MRFLVRQPMGKWAIQALEAGQSTIECLLRTNAESGIANSTTIDVQVRKRDYKLLSRQPICFFIITVYPQFRPSPGKGVTNEASGSSITEIKELIQTASSAVYRSANTFEEWQNKR